MIYCVAASLHESVYDKRKKGQKMKSIYSIMIAYALVLTPSCKNGHAADSKNKDSLLGLSESKVKEFAGTSKARLKDIHDIVRSEATSQAIPVVVVNLKDGSRRYTKGSEVENSEQLKPYEKIFLGEIDSRFIMGLSIPELHSTSEHLPNKVNLIFSQFDTTKQTTYENLIQFKRVDSMRVEIATNLDEDSMREQIGNASRKMNSYFNRAYSAERHRFLKKNYDQGNLDPSSYDANNNFYSDDTLVQRWEAPIGSLIGTLLITLLLMPLLGDVIVNGWNPLKNKVVGVMLVFATLVILTLGFVILYASLSDSRHYKNRNKLNSLRDEYIRDYQELGLVR